MNAVGLRLAEPPVAQIFVAPAAPRRAPARGLVDRPRLLRRLAMSPAPVALLVAPAGYGKSALLAQWEARDERPFAWVALSSRDGGTAGATASIASALEGLGVPAPRAGAPVTGLARTWEAFAPPHVLVLDGAEVLTGPDAADLLAALVEHVPDGSTLAIASRTEPPLAVGRLRAEGALLELRGRDLAMNGREAAAVLRRTGVRIDAQGTEAVTRATEGWPAAVRLAGLALREQRDLGAAVARFGGEDRLVADYVDDTLLSRLAPSDLRLLERTAPLDRLSGRLCDAVLQRRGTGRALRRLSRSGLPLTALDRAEELFRVHPLLGAALRARLRREDPEDEVEIHRRASLWHEREGDLAAALDHAITARDADRAAELLWRAVPAFAPGGPDSSVERWLARIDDEQIAARPPLALAAAAAALARGERDVAERWHTTATRAIDDAPRGAPPHVAGAALALRAAIGRQGIVPMVADAEQARALSPRDGAWYAAACLLEGVGRHLLGQHDEARERLEEGARRAVASSPGVRSLCLAQLAILAFDGGDQDTADALAVRAHEELTDHRLGDQPAGALVFAVCAYARSQAGPVGEARDHVAHARRLLGAGRDASPWLTAEVHVMLARAELRLSDAAAARSLLVEASRALRPVPETTAVHTWIDETWDLADTFAVGAVIGRAALTTAELRVLRFLPSHLSFREIAGRLHVSANTVKTQAHAVYRKLDASSRSEAVTRARAVGLVDG